VASVVASVVASMEDSAAEVRVEVLATIVVATAIATAIVTQMLTHSFLQTMPTPMRTIVMRIGKIAIRAKHPSAKTTTAPFAEAIMLSTTTWIIL